MEQQRQGPDKRAIIGILLCAVVWGVYMQTNYARQQQTLRDQKKAGAATVSTNGAMAMNPAATPGAAMSTTSSGAIAVHAGPQIPEKTVELSNKVLDLQISNVGARPVAVDLKTYRKAVKTVDDKNLVSLVSPAIVGSTTIAPLVPWFGDSQTSLVPADARFEIVSQSENEVVFRWTGPNGLRVTRAYKTNEDDYVVDLTETVENIGSAPLTGKPGLLWATNLKGVKSSFLRPGDTDFNSVAGIADRVQTKNAKNPEEDRTFGGLVDWVGVEDRYFIAAAIPLEPRFDGPLAVRFFKPGTKSVAALAVGPETKLEPGKSATFKHQLYLGPKDYKVLQKAGHNLDSSIAWGGILTPISKGLWHLLQWFHSWAKNWGLAIVLLTVVIRGLLSPLAAKQMKTSNEFAAKSAKLKPQLDRMREKFKDDPMKLNQETMALYKSHGLSPFSPLAGCLPILVQMPIWFALYRVLWSSIDLRQAPFTLWIQDLAAPDPWKILPIALGAVTFIQMKLTPNTGMDPAQAKMMQYTMPLVFTLPMLGLPSGLVLYIFTSTLINIAQQWYLRKVIPAPPSNAVPAATQQGGAT